MEIIMGTSMGFLYVMDHKGIPLDGWPIQVRGCGAWCMQAVTVNSVQAVPSVMDHNRRLAQGCGAWACTLSLSLAHAGCPWGVIDHKVNPLDG